MGAEAIIEKIRENAEREADELRKQGEERAAAAAQAILSQARQEAEAVLKAASDSAAELSKREKLMTVLESRKNTLKSRRTLIDEAFELSYRMLCELPDERKKALLSRLIVEAVDTGDERLEVPVTERPIYETGGFLEDINKTLRSRGKKGALELSDAPSALESGFRLCGEKYDVDASFRTLLRLERDKCEHEIYRMLFPEEA